MKINLGCGSDLLKGYINVDIHKPEISKSNEPVENFKFYKSNVENLSWIENESVSEIRAKDIIDHIYWKNLENTFKEWNRILKKNGYLIIRYIPDFEKSFIKYFNSKRTKEDWEKVQKWVDMLSYKLENFRSKNLIDLQYLKTLLNSCGFVIEKYWYEEEELNLDCKKIR